jgi:protein O-mannosyl-transferase
MMTIPVAAAVTPSETRTGWTASGRLLTPRVLLPAYCLLGLILYQPAFTGPPLFDDHALLRDSAATDSLSALLTSQSWLHPETRPLVRFSFDLETRIFGSGMWLRRCTNVLIHAGTATVLFSLIRQLLKRDLTLRREAAVIAGLAALLWLVHPVSTSAVAYVAQRCESLMGLFFLLYLLSVARLSDGGGPRQAILAVVWFLAGLSSKTIMIAAPACGLLMDRAFTGPSWRDVLLRQWRILLVPALGSLAAATLLLPGILRGEANVGFGGDAPSPGLYLAAQARIFWLYLAQSCWPVDLSVDHGLRPPLEIRDMAGWITLTLLFIGLTLVGWHRGYRRSTFLLLAPLTILSLTSSVIPTADLRVDHRMYVPLAALMAGVTLGTWTLIRALHRHSSSLRVFPAAICGLALLFSLRTWHRAHEFQSGTTIWSSAVRMNPDNDRAIQNLIDASRAENRENELIPFLKRARRAAELRGIVPIVLVARLGELTAKRGDPGQAVVYLQEAIQLDERHFYRGYRASRRSYERFAMEINLGLALAALGSLHEARRHVEFAFEFADSSADARALAGSLAADTGDPTAARKHFTRALELRPNWQDVQQDLDRLTGP